MAQKCVHKGCGKLFSDLEEPCVYHPGPPVFHEGQKGWKCCKPRVLTFDEFMTIPPCTTGQHSTVDDTPTPEPQPSNEDVDAKIKAQQDKQDGLQTAVHRAPSATSAPKPPPLPAPPEVEEDDDPTIPIPDGATCKRKTCGASYKSGQSRDGEECIHHPGQALFHEGSKGWTCCKRRVLEFDEFMKISGCTTKPRHLFVGAKKAKEEGNGKDAATTESEEEELKSVRNDFYQTATTVIASLYLKKIDKDRSKVEFGGPSSLDGDGDGVGTVDLDLRTSDGKRYRTRMTTFGAIEPEKCGFMIMGTKVEMTLVKRDGSGWPVLRKDDPLTGEIIQTGRPGRV